MKKSYRIIGFGTNEHGFFNHFAWRSDIESAKIAYSHFYCDPEFDGVVIIEVEHETWEVIKECNMEGLSVTCGPFMNFKVEKSPALVRV